MTALCYTALFEAAGLAAIRFLLPKTNLPERIWLGLSLGILLEMWLPALCAYPLTFGYAAHFAAIAVLVALVTLAWFLRDPSDVKKFSEDDRKQVAVMAAVCLPLTAFSVYLQATHMILPAADGSYWCGQSTYGDLCMHLSFITSIENMPFPPSYNLLYDTPLSYPYLTDSLSTTFYMMGLPLNLAVVLPGSFLMALTFAGYMLLCRRFLGSRKKAIAVAAVFFFLNGGLGFLYDFDMAGKDHFARIMEIFSGFYKTPANQPEYNLRFSNVIADLMIPQRSLLGGWAMILPCLWLLDSSQKNRSVRETVLLALWAGALPLVHTHTFLALGLFSGGYLMGRLIVCREDRKGTLQRSALYLIIVLLLACPQLLGNAVKQTLEGGSLRFQFNWVNNSGGRGMIDGYFWFWIKNAGLPFILVLCALLNAKRRGQVETALGMTAVYAVAEFILFQPNEYDNNKLFYIWFMFAMILAADYGSILMQRLSGLRGRGLICALFIFCSVFSGSLSLAREAVSSYQLFNPSAVDAGNWIRQNTERDSVFLTGQQHINPVCSLAGRQIICGSDLYVFFHGLDYRTQAEDCRRYYEQPEAYEDVLKKYHVDYVYVSDYERADFDVDLETIKEQWPLVYENGSVKIFRVNAEES
ncbi:MAG: hypothetical protein IJ573_04715 [Clostridia bacterium]|nr:hypothetical protein [Clostridia bacterium]